MSAEPHRRLVLLRHGQTAWNATGRAQGHTDVGLDDLGHAQAAAVAPRVAALRPVLLRTSDLARARETAAYVAEATGLTATSDPRLREYDVGARAGLTVEEFAARFPDEYADWRRGSPEAVPGAEGTEDVLARFVPALTDVLSGLTPGETGVVVAHGAALRVGVAALLGWGPEVAGTLGVLGNAALAVVTEGPGEGTRRLAAWNVAGPAPDFASPDPVG